MYESRHQYKLNKMLEFFKIAKSTYFYTINTYQQMDEDTEIKIQAILGALQPGCFSPVLYRELCALYNEQPTRLKELTRENIAAVFGSRDFVNIVLIKGDNGIFSKIIMFGSLAIIFLYAGQVFVWFWQPIRGEFLEKINIFFNANFCFSVI